MVHSSACKRYALQDQLRNSRRRLMIEFYRLNQVKEDMSPELRNHKVRMYCETCQELVLICLKVFTPCLPSTIEEEAKLIQDFLVCTDNHAPLAATSSIGTVYKRASSSVREYRTTVNPSCSLQPCPNPRDPQTSTHFDKYHTIPAPGCKKTGCRWILGESTLKDHKRRYHQLETTGPDGRKISRNLSDGRFHCLNCSTFSAQLPSAINKHMKGCRREVVETGNEERLEGSQPLGNLLASANRNIPKEGTPHLTQVSGSTSIQAGVATSHPHRKYVKKVDGTPFSPEDEIYLERVFGVDFVLENIDVNRSAR